MPRAATLACTLALMAPLPALGADAPPQLALTQDTTIVFQTEASAPAAIAGSFGNYAGTKTVSLSASGWRRMETRIKMENLGTELPPVVGLVETKGKIQREYIFDEPNRRVAIRDLNTDDYDFTDIQFFTLSGDWKATRQGPDKVAGIECAAWRFERAGDVVESCIAANGLTLRYASVTSKGIRNNQKAVSVSVAPLSPSLFEIPAGWRVDPPK